MNIRYYRGQGDMRPSVRSNRSIISLDDLSVLHRHKGSSDYTVFNIDDNAIVRTESIKPGQATTTAFHYTRPDTPSPTIPRHDR